MLEHPVWIPSAAQRVGERGRLRELVGMSGRRVAPEAGAATTANRTGCSLRARSGRIGQASGTRKARWVRCPGRPGRPQPVACVQAHRDLGHSCMNEASSAGRCTCPEGMVAVNRVRWAAAPAKRNSARATSIIPSAARLFEQQRAGIGEADGARGSG